jgi:CBS-domain-containing membrane protein
VLLFGHPYSPLSQPRNIVLGNTVAAVVSVICVALLGNAPWVMGLAVGGTIALGQLLRCLHPPAGAVALLGVLLQAKPAFVLVPVLSGSVLLTLMAVAFSRLRPATEPYPHHWF